MTKCTFPTREQYVRLYRLMRQGFDPVFVKGVSAYSWEIIKAADYSYQAFGYIVSGWTNDQRCKRFYAIKYRIASIGEYLPF